MDLSTRALTILVFVSLGLSALTLLILAVSSGRRRPKGDGLRADLDGAIRGALDGQGRSLQRLDSLIRQLAQQDRDLDLRVQGAVQLMGLVRYDAFAEMGGRLSFSCALLDGKGDGVVITSINGRQDTRVYAKPVRDGQSSHNLSEEEEQAIRQALSGPRETVRAT